MKMILILAFRALLDTFDETRLLYCLRASSPKHMSKQLLPIDDAEAGRIWLPTLLSQAKPA
jgi:hypothetical protein